MNSATQGPPATGGWTLLDPARFGEFEAITGPLYGTTETEAGEPFRIGLRIEPKHCNKAGFCHGGAMATFLDMALGLAMRTATKATDPSPTMTLTVDYLGAAASGDWIESRARVVQATYKTAFCDVIALGPKGPVARANAIFKLTRPKEA